LRVSSSWESSIRGLTTEFPYYVALSREVEAKAVGFSRGDFDEAYVQCLDPCDITGGGTVRFLISREP
jgi:hypothetical protein